MRSRRARPRSCVPGPPSRRTPTGSRPGAIDRWSRRRRTRRSTTDGATARPRGTSWPSCGAGSGPVRFRSRRRTRGCRPGTSAQRTTRGLTSRENGTESVLVFHTSTNGDDLLWYWATDWRLGLSGLSNGILQLMHPGLGAGVAEHSDFFDEPWARIMRSVGPIVASIRDDGTARAIKEMHRDIKGSDAHGDRYHALDPETFWWAHITLYRAVEQAARRFSAGGLSDAQRDEMYAGGMSWYRRYGVSERRGAADPSCVHRTVPPDLHRRARDDSRGGTGGGHGAARTHRRAARSAELARHAGGARLHPGGAVDLDRRVARRWYGDGSTSPGRSPTTCSTAP